MNKYSKEQIFLDVYKQHTWGSGTDSSDLFYSGVGSRLEPVVDVYVEAIHKFVTSLGYKPTVTDLGCGDFTVGAKTRHLFSSYVACDVVGELIEHHKVKHSNLDVDFRHLDICSSPLPKSDIGIVRQVLQHLSNQDIIAFIRKAEASFKYLICTEHIPMNTNFIANLDKPTGFCIRLGFNSGVILSRPPFNIKATHEEVICTVSGPPELCGGIVVTTLYQLY